MAKFGLPYMGSKSEICDELIKRLPKADHFYDLFGGGFSVTHAMLTRRPKDFKKFHFNEIRPGICELIQSAIKGEFNYDKFKPPFIDRDTFFNQLGSDAYIKMCWSFGNNGRNYLFSKEIEPYKKSMQNAIVFNDFDDLARKVFECDRFKDGFTINEKRLFLRNKIEQYRKTKIPDCLIQFIDEKMRQKPKQLQQLMQLQQLQQLEQLMQLQQLERLTFTNLSYEKIEIKPDSIIYCDPPYAGTGEYDGKFDHKKFLDWAHSQPNPVFISEYKIDDLRFKPVFKIKKRSLFKIKKRSLLSSKKDSAKIKYEMIYANYAGIKCLSKKMRLAK